MNTQETFFVEAYLTNQTGETTWPFAVRRLSDNKLFQLGDHVGDYADRQGFIDRFEHDKETKEMRICINKSDEKGIPLSEAQYYKCIYVESITGDHVTYLGIPASILGVHTYAGKTKYDVELVVSTGERTRAYNVDSDYVKLETEEKTSLQESKGWVIADNSDAFRLFLRESGVNYIPYGPQTKIPAYVDIFTLGEKWGKYKTAHGK